VELDKDRLAKLLSMTSSDHDAEALAAMRKANELLRANRKSWFDVLGLNAPPAEPIRASQSSQSSAGSPSRPQTAALPPGYQLLRQYRDALRREPFLPRLLGLPFWLLIELSALLLPRAHLNTRGNFIAIIFALGMLTGIAGWIWLGYYLLFVL
jgi:hypothetical protein